MIKAWALLCLVAVVGAVGCDDTGEEGNGSPAGPSGLALSGCTAAPADLVAWLPGDGHSNDIAGHNHGSLQNGAGFATGQVGQAFNFNTANEYVSVPDAAPIDFAGTDPMTVDMWVRTTATGVQHLLGKRDGCTTMQYQMAQDGSSGLHFTGSGTVATNVQLAVNVWTHLAVTADGDSLRFYINGVLQNTAAGTMGANTTSDLRIGASSTCGATFAGQIDEVELFDRALSGSEIAAIYNAGTAGKCKPHCQGRAQTTTGTINGGQIDLTEGDDVWVGTGADETVYGYAGNDRMCGRGGADELHGGDDQDKLQGDNGPDLLFGENDDDKLYGNAGKDHLDGGAGSDKCSGGGGVNTQVDCES